MRNVLVGDMPVALGSRIVQNESAVVSDEECHQLVLRRLARDLGPVVEAEQPEEQPKAQNDSSRTDSDVKKERRVKK